MRPLRFLRLRLPILEQLRVEEALLRADTAHNWCVINRLPASSGRAVVLGISGKPAELVHEEAARRDGVMLVKRFSGGGTVLLDEDCSMVSFVVREDALERVPAFPRPVLQWSARLYADVFPSDSGFVLEDHDYCLRHLKVGGNAQSLVRRRWLHHTSFLWDVNAELLERYLKMPKRVPEYRRGRSHSDFVIGMKHLFPSVSEFEDGVLAALAKYFVVEEADMDEHVAPIVAANTDFRTVVL